MGLVASQWRVKAGEVDQLSLAQKGGLGRFGLGADVMRACHDKYRCCANLCFSEGQDGTHVALECLALVHTEE